MKNKTKANRNIHHKSVRAIHSNGDNALWDGECYFLCFDTLARFVPSILKAENDQRFEVSASAAPFSRCKEMRIKISCSELSGWAIAEHWDEVKLEWSYLYIEAQIFALKVLGKEEQETTIYFSIKKAKKG